MEAMTLLINPFRAFPGFRHQNAGCLLPNGQARQHQVRQVGIPWQQPFLVTSSAERHSKMLHATNPHAPITSVGIRGSLTLHS